MASPTPVRLGNRETSALFSRTVVSRASELGGGGGRQPLRGTRSLRPTPCNTYRGVRGPDNFHPDGDAGVSGRAGPRGPLPTHLRQVLVVEQMRLAGFEAVLTLALVEDIGLEFPARVLLGRRHGRRGGSEARRPGPARAPRRTAAGGAAAPCTAGSGGEGRAQRGRRGMPPLVAAASQPSCGRRPERVPGGQDGLVGAEMLAGPSLARRRGAARRVQAPPRRAPRPGPSQRVRSPPLVHTAAARPPRAHGRGLLGPLPPHARARLSGAGSLPVPAVGVRRCCPRRPAAAANGSRAPRALPGRGGGRVPGRVRGRRELRGSARGGATPDAIGGPVDQWQRRAPANKENPRPMETGGGNKGHPGVR